MRCYFLFPLLPRDARRGGSSPIAPTNHSLIASMPTRNRKVLLFIALAGVVGLAVFAPDPRVTESAALSLGTAYSAKSDAASLPARDAEKSKPQVVIKSVLPERGKLGDPAVDLFGSESWLPPAPKMVIAPPAPPLPPPMSYRFAGRVLQDGKLQVFVSRGDIPIAVKAGDNLDGYVVESVTASAIALVYPPLGHREIIAIPAAFSAEVAASPSNLVMSPFLPAPGAAPGQRGAGVAVPAAQPQINSAAGNAPAKSAAGLARVQWDGPAQVKLGENFTLALRVDADQPINGSPMQVRFDPAILQSVAVRPGRRYAADAGREFNYRLNPGGTIFVGASSQTVSSAGASDCWC